MARKTIGRRMLALGLGLIATALTSGWAAPAEAGAASAGREDVLIPGTDFDLGGETFSSGAPDGPGTLRWLMDGGEPKPEVDAYIHIKNANGSCAYIQLDYLDRSGSVLNQKTSPRVCAPNNQLNTFEVELGGYKNPFISEVRVMLVKVTGSGPAAVGTRTIDFGPYVDEVLVAEDGFAFGSADFADGAPTGHGTVTWTYDLGARAHLDGRIHVDGVAGACTRMQLEYLDGFGFPLGTENGGKVCAADDDHQAWRVDFGGAFTSFAIASVNVNQQTLGVDGVWRTAGSDQAFFTAVAGVATLP